MTTAIEIPQWYADWARAWLITFGRADDERLRLAFEFWYPSFAALGYTESELSEVTARVIGGAASIPIFPDAVLERIKAEIRDIRGERRRTAESERLARPTSWAAWNAYKKAHPKEFRASLGK